MAAFDDVEPIPQDDGPRPIVPIDYPREYARLMGVFRAILKSGERSPRVLELTGDLVEHNAAHYTVWHVRRQCLWALAEGDPDVLGDEMAYAADVARENPKNYQIWYHRRALVERIGAARRGKNAAVPSSRCMFFMRSVGRGFLNIDACASCAAYAALRRRPRGSSAGGWIVRRALAAPPRQRAG